MKMSIDFIVECVNGMVLRQGAYNHISGVSTDSRRIESGDLFIALRGENFDGHNFIKQAIEKGAGAILLSAYIPDYEKHETTIIKVSDTLEALQKLATGYRQLFKIPFIAVTGSVGKTTTKELLALCLSSRYQTLKTQGNLNNEIGLPLTLFELKEEQQAAVVELGMSAPEEISVLGKIVQPDYAIISNVEPVHIETLGTLENIARAKCEILPFIQEGKFALINGDSEILLAVAKEYDCKKILFGYHENCEIRIISVLAEKGGITVELKVFDQVQTFYLPVPAVQLATNLASAVGMAYLLGVDLQQIRESLCHYKPSGNRLSMTSLKGGGTLINDTYNANPASMITALEVCKRIANGERTVAVLGDMFELGQFTRQGHMMVGNRVAELEINTLVAIGDSAQYIVEGALQKGMLAQDIFHFQNRHECLGWLKDNLDQTGFVVFKGSRGMQLDLLVEEWLED